VFLAASQAAQTLTSQTVRKSNRVIFTAGDGNFQIPRAITIETCLLQIAQNFSSRELTISS
jgi:hypothetical protein